MKKTGFNGYVYDFSVGYDDIKVDNVKDIQKYLMKKNNIIKNVFDRVNGFIKCNPFSCKNTI